jgi:hypothetical protein
MWMAEPYPQVVPAVTAPIRSLAARTGLRRESRPNPSRWWRLTLRFLVLFLLGLACLAAALVLAAHLYSQARRVIESPTPVSCALAVGNTTRQRSKRGFVRRQVPPQSFLLLRPVQAG